MNVSDRHAALRREQAADWVLRLSGGELSLEDEIQLELWLEEDTANREVLQYQGWIWETAVDIADALELASVREDALEAMRGANTGRWSRRIGSQWRGFAAMAACLLFLVATFSFLHGQSTTYRTLVGERRVVELDDGSRMSLDADSAVDVSYGGERRSLRLLAGRAKFDVAKDPRRPFTVVAGGRMVVATGTSFSVELTKANMQVVLYEGSVAVLKDGPIDRPPQHLLLPKSADPADQLLKPGTALVTPLDDAVATVEPVDLLRTLSWQNGQLHFVEEPLALAVERMNRYSREKIVLGNGKLGTLSISGVFDAGDIEGFVDGASTLYDLAVERKGDTVVLKNR